MNGWLFVLTLSAGLLIGWVACAYVIAPVYEHRVDGLRRALRVIALLDSGPAGKAARDVLDLDDSYVAR